MNKYALIVSTICAAFLLCSCGTTTKSQAFRERKAMTARITYYTRHEDSFGSKVACPAVKRAVEGETVAAHRDFPYGTTVEIPDLRGKVGDGVFKVEDRGRDINSKKASHGQLYVFDVFLECSNKQMRRFASTVPPNMPVYIQN